jgi:Rrf2 family protein
MSGNSRFSVAAHVMTVLAYDDAASISSRRIAESVRTNPVVIRRLLVLLGKAGLVESQVGKGGGVRLARSAGSITLLDIYKAVEGGSPFVVPDKPENKACEVSCAMKPILASVLAEADRAMSRSLEKVRLSDVVRQIAAAQERPA